MTLYLTLSPKYTNNKTLNQFYENCNSNYSDDSGFDLVCPDTLTVKPGETLTLDLGVTVTCTQQCDLFPRSSIYKTPLRLSNSFNKSFQKGPVEFQKKYSHNLKVTFTNVKDYEYTITQGDRLVQLCLPSLKPFEFQFMKLFIKLRTEDDFLLNHYQNNQTIAVPKNYTANPGDTCKVPLGISCQPSFNAGYYLTMRESALRLVNVHGIIDVGYRGGIMAIVENDSDEPITIKQGSDMFMLEGPHKYKLSFELREELSTTKRGEGGFGSTGK
jgi:dUTP pyrophosphatase